MNWVRKNTNMTPEEFVIDIFNKANIRECDFQSRRFFPCLFLHISRGHFEEQTSTFLQNLTAPITIRIRNVFIHMTIKQDQFPDEQWKAIPKKLNKGLMRLHDKGKLIPLIQTHHLL